MDKLPNFSNASYLDMLRYWLLKKIAGKCVVMLNCNLEIIDQQTSARLIVDGVKGGLFRNVTFPAQDGQILKVTQNG